MEAYLRTIRKVVAAALMFAIGLGFAIAISPIRLSQQTPFETFALLAAALGFSIAVALVPWERYHPAASLALSLLIVALLMLLVARSGGGESPYFPFFVLVAVITGAYQDRLPLFVIAIAASLGALSVLLYTPATHVLLRHLVVLVAALFLSGFISNVVFRHLQQSFQGAQERFRRAFEDAATGMALIGTDGHYLEVNRALSQMLGYSTQELVGRGCSTVLHPEDLATVRERAHQLLAGKVPAFEVEQRYRHKLGHDVWVHLGLSLVRDPQGNPLCAMGQYQNITERRRMEEALRDSEAHFRTIFDGAPIGIARVDLDGRFLDTNDAFNTLLGRTGEELRSLTCFELLHPENPFPPMMNLVQSLREGKRDLIHAEKRLLRSDGSVIWVALTLAAMLTSDSEPPCCVAMVEDITARKEAERQLEVLTQTEKLRALGQLASGAAHDLNQHLALIAGHGDLLLRLLDETTPDKGRLRDYVGTIVRAATDGGETVRRLLAFSRTRGIGSVTLVDLGELLCEVSKLTAPRWRDAAQQEGRPISLTVESDGNITIRGQPGSLRDAFTNLVLNAVDALPAGGTIRLAARRRGGHVIAEVADNGVGMTPETQGRIYEPFFSTKGDHGSGLGLSLVFGIVQQHEGVIAVQSAVGLGTTFRLSFPAAQVRQTQAVAAPAVDATRPLRILAVDDEIAMGKMITDMLVRDGHRVVIATSGEQALERLHVEPFDIVLSDVGMGAGMNGWELAEHVRTGFPAVRLVLVTGWEAQIDPSQAKALGIEAVLAKPYRLTELRKVISGISEQLTRPHNGTSGT